ncbi:peptidoglycan-binding protein [Streptomyces cupreus]|uniref:Peptidoglycan-binding protein n=1 Tax=Streptomyces cupreus TaxID=2759956 RepID=A0A7X1MGE1_9ACTN|nr:peptidoglycan-binding protein [Streptomyces cupreus]
MTNPNDHGCPECGAPRGADNTPSCACTERASEALRDAREAQAAAAEDFNPLRIRPYVELEGTAEADPAATMPLHTPLVPVPPPAEPNATDVGLFEAPQSTPEPATEDRPRRRRRTVPLLGAAGALVGVVAAAGMAGGLFSYETPTRDTALPEGVRASVPDATPSETNSASPSKSATLTSASPSASATKSESPSPSASTATATASATPTPTQTPTPARASDAPPQETTEAPNPPVLRRGDKGAEVTELQLRLQQLHLYNGDINGNFNQPLEEALKNYQWSRGVGTEELGVYTAETRASLESETTEP